MQRIVEDLFGSYFDLFISCPNAVHDVNLNREKYLPNPAYSENALALDMYEFVGKLMGVSLRTNLSLPFHFPSYIWKGLAKLEVGQEDLAAVDSLLDKWLREIEDCDEETFDWKYGDESEEVRVRLRECFEVS